MSCAFAKVRDLPRYADLAAEQDSSAPDAEKLDPNQVEDCIKSTVCCSVSEAYDAKKFIHLLTDLEEFFGNADHLP